jgi:hypothetical protein
MRVGTSLKLLVFLLALGGIARAQEAPPAPPPAAAEPTAAEPEVAGEPDDGDGPVRLSLATEDDLAAWRRPGFRLALGANYGALAGLDGPPGGWLLGVLLRVGARLDDHWSLMSSFQYGSASATGGLAGLRITGERPEDALFGLRFAGTLEPTWHINDHFELALGMGFGGLVEAATTGRPDVDEARRNALNGSYTYPGADPALPSCKGVGVAGLVRGGWHLILGPRSATGVTLEVFGQWTGCVDDTQRLELDTARPIVRRQWWPHLGSTVAWTVTWR